LVVECIKNLYSLFSSVSFMSSNLPMQIVNTGSYSEILINYFLIIFRNTFTAIFSVPLLRHKPK